MLQCLLLLRQHLQLLLQLKHLRQHLHLLLLPSHQHRHLRPTGRSKEHDQPHDQEKELLYHPEMSH